MLINGSTKILAVLGDPISHSLSPVIHNAAFKASNLNAVYIPCHVNPENIFDAVKAIKAFQFHGVNVTIPYKQTIYSLLDEIGGDSVYTGSVNTVLYRKGVLYGTSTDGVGFVRSIKEDGKFDLVKKKVLIFGAGGTAFAIAFRLINSGVSSLYCINRNLSKVEILKKELYQKTGFEITAKQLTTLKETDLTTFDLLINTTSVGLTDDLSLIPKNQLHQGLFVYDVVYKKGGTRLIREAKEMGCRFLDGLSLLVYQGAESFRLWFDQEPPIHIMKDSLKDYLVNNHKH